MQDVLIVGAGIAGLMAAAQLQRHGFSVTVLDKGRGVGGRMATRRIGNGRADHGAQFFTVREHTFRVHVNGWITNGWVRQWSQGWSRGSAAAPTQDGHPRYVGDEGMTTVPKRLAQDLDVRTGVRVTAVSPGGNGWQVTDQGGSHYEGRALLLTPPVPQSLALLANGEVLLVNDDRWALERIQYDPCLAGLFVVDGDVQLPEPGALQRPEQTFPWIADNQRKGISPHARIITVHAAPELTWSLWEADDALKISTLQSGLDPFLAADAVIKSAQVHRWRFAIPTTLHDARTLLAQNLPPLAFAGDAFKEPRVEGAALSGLSAAEALTAVL